MIEWALKQPNDGLLWVGIRILVWVVLPIAFWTVVSFVLR